MQSSVMAKLLQEPQWDHVTKSTTVADLIGCTKCLCLLADNEQVWTRQALTTRLSIC